MQTNIYILFWIKKKPHKEMRKRQNLGTALRDISKALISPEDVVCFGPPGSASLVMGWRTWDGVLGVYKCSALFEGNRSGTEV